MVNSVAYEQFTQSLQEQLAADNRVLSLVALGSMADSTRRDQWSDHDFWVITQTGEQETFLADLSWLPNAEQIILAFRQAGSYYTVVYQDGHSIEFAVFDREQMQRGKTNRSAVLIDKAELASAIQQLQAQTLTSTSAQQTNVNSSDLANYFFLQLLTGVQRHFRGEFLSSQHEIDAALNNLLTLIQHHIPAQDARMVDSFDLRRHFERTYPTLASEIHAALQQAMPTKVLGLLEIANTHLAARIPTYPYPLGEVIREKINAANQPRPESLE